MLSQHCRDITVFFHKTKILYCIPVYNPMETSIGTQLQIEVINHTAGVPSLVKSSAGISKLVVSLPSHATYMDCLNSEKRTESYLR